MAVKFFDQAALKHLLNKLKTTFVRQEEGKGLSSNDFTDTLKNKLETMDGAPEYSSMTGATTDKAGTTGLVPAPEAGKQDAYLKGDGTWAVPENTTYDVATPTKNGLMASTDKEKLDGIDAMTTDEIDTIYEETIESTTTEA